MLDSTTADTQPRINFQTLLNMDVIKIETFQLTEREKIDNLN